MPLLTCALPVMPTCTLACCTARTRFRQHCNLQDILQVSNPDPRHGDLPRGAVQPVLAGRGFATPGPYRYYPFSNPIFSHFSVSSMVPSSHPTTKLCRIFTAYPTLRGLAPGALWRCHVFSVFADVSGLSRRLLSVLGDPPHLLPPILASIFTVARTRTSCVTRFAEELWRGSKFQCVVVIFRPGILIFYDFWNPVRNATQRNPSSSQLSYSTLALISYFPSYEVSPAGLTAAE